MLLARIAILVACGTMVAFAPGYPVLMAGRAILGIAIGGFWSMSAAIAMRLVPAQDVPKALASSTAVTPSLPHSRHRSAASWAA